MERTFAFGANIADMVLGKASVSAARAGDAATHRLGTLRPWKSQLHCCRLVGFVVALVAAPAGVSGAFLLLPFQVSVLGITGTSVTATNLVYNLAATPGGLVRYWQEQQMDWPLVLNITAGSLPGVLIGSILRVTVFGSPVVFKAFVGMMLVALAIKLFVDILVARRRMPASKGEHGRASVVVVSLVVGVVGGIYGIGGGSIVAPYLVAIVGRSVYRVAGAALCATFVTSLVGVIAFQALA